MDYAFYGMRPAVTGLIAAAAVSVMQVAVFNTELFKQTGSLIDLADPKKIIFFALILYYLEYSAFEYLRYYRHRHKTLGGIC